jgi:erythromycin esterase
MRALPPRSARATAAALAIAALAITGCSVDVNEPEFTGPERSPGTPLGWQLIGTLGAPEFGRPYTVGLDRTTFRGGRAAAYVTAVRSVQSQEFGGLSQSISALPYRGLRVRWSMWLRTTEVSGTAGAWIRVDGAGRTLAFDNMNDRPIRGTRNWTQATVVVDVPTNAVVMTLGALLGGPGDLLIDDAQLEVVDSSVPVTDQLAGMPLEQRPVAPTTGAPTATAPMNGDFEGTSASTNAEASLAWLRRNTASFRTAEPGGDVTDLAPLGAMLGDARLVALGESTHGTREFFQLKHRVFEYLVREKGFTHFAIEGSWAESNEIDHYVRTGEGDPRRLLSRLGFWTWNTEEVLALIEWMRQWNTSASPDRQVRFLGFDMQFASLPADTVEAFVSRELPSASDSVRAWLACIGPWRRTSEAPARPMRDYAQLGAAERAQCRDGLAKVAALLEGYRGNAPAANARQSARVLQQWERVAGVPSAEVTLERDAAMAENVSWLRAQSPQGAGFMLWAHNAHVSNVAPFMGELLRARYGDDYRAVGLLFGTGGFTAQAVPLGTGLRTFNATLTPPGSMESALGLLGDAHLMFDARALLRPGNDEGAPYRGPVTMRYIGSAFNPLAEPTVFVARRLPDHYDHLLFVRETTASRTLPFVN